MASITTKNVLHLRRFSGDFSDSMPHGRRRQIRDFIHSVTLMFIITTDDYDHGLNDAVSDDTHCLHCSKRFNSFLH